VSSAYSSFLLRRPSSFYTAAESSATYATFDVRQQPTIYGSACSRDSDLMDRFRPHLADEK
jgi:hypothetical protein